MTDAIERYLPNRQTNVKNNFAYLALDGFARLAKGTPMEPPNNIKAIRERQKMTLEDLAEKSGISVSYLSRIEAGTRNLTVKNINKIAPSLGATGPELIATGHKPQRIKISGKVQAGDWIPPDEEPVFGEDFVDIPISEGLRQFRLYALRVVGESMNLAYPEGSLVICAHLAETHERPISGKRYVVRRTRADGSHETTVKEYVIDHSGKHWLMPRSTEPEWQQPIVYNDGSEGDLIELQARVLFSVRPE